MGEVEPIIVRKFHIGKLSVLGIYFGILLGLILGIIAFFYIFNAPEVSFSWGETTGLSGTNLALAGAGAIFILSVIFGLVVGALFAVFYNLFAKIGGEIHFDLED
ncbi:MAG: hypothetical protein AABW80_02380 [Nanoarchaeota archaeon]